MEENTTFNENKPLRKINCLRVKFALIFTVFSLIILCFSGFATYANQMKSYKALCLEHVRNVGLYLEKLIQDSADEFAGYQKYYMEHFAEIDIPYDFDEYDVAEDNFQMLIAKSDAQRFENIHDINFDTLSEEEQKAYFIYCHEYWLLAFEHAREAFELPYTYYLVPKEEESIMVYMIDGERTHKGPDGEKADEGKYLYLGDEYLDPVDRYPVQWNTWFTGKMQDDFQVWDNEWGYTYAYYIPLFLNGQKLGLIGTEIQVEKLNKAILKNTLWQSGVMAIGLAVFLTLLTIFISHRYIRKISYLVEQVRKFSEEKNPQIAYEIQARMRGRNEITLLSYQFASMIQELEMYMRNLLATNKELLDTKQHARIMNELATKDSLTGIRNKTAYDNEVLRLEEQLMAGKKQFGLIMVDLNYLKRINDNFGHERGNVSIKTLCDIICEVFNHSPVFRVGGDEFVVILEHSDYENVDQLVKIFNYEIESLKSVKGLEPWERVSAAIGYALYDENIDENVSSVFERADKAMYEHKRQMKAERES